jgi:hypothetical protein
MKIPIQLLVWFDQLDEAPVTLDEIELVGLLHGLLLVQKLATRRLVPGEVLFDQEALVRVPSILLVFLSQLCDCESQPQ